MEAASLSYSYPLDGNGRLPVIEDLSLSVEEGEFLVILGASGCGKSTLLKLLAGFLTPEQGQVLFRGKAVEKPFRKGQMVFQDPHQLLPWLTVEENILFPVKKRNAIRGELDGMLRKVGLEESRFSYPAQLSGGMKQRCALARSLYGTPDILFMDEPFVSLDAPSRNHLQRMVQDMGRERGVTVFFVTHDVSEALLLADRFLLLGGTRRYRTFPNPLPLPRDRWSENFLREEIRLHSLLEEYSSNR